MPVVTTQLNETIRVFMPPYYPAPGRLTRQIRTSLQVIRICLVSGFESDAYWTCYEKTQQDHNFQERHDLQLAAALPLRQAHHLSKRGRCGAPGPVARLQGVLGTPGQ